MVPLVGVFSTREHPFGLVYEYMDGLDLTQYLKNAYDVDRLNLVLLLCIHPPAVQKPSHLSCLQVAQIARDLSRIHSLGIAHRGLQMVRLSPVLLTLIAQLTYISHPRRIS